MQSTAEKIKPLIREVDPEIVNTMGATMDFNSQDDIMQKLDNAINKIDQLDVIKLNNTLGKIDQMFQHNSLMGSASDPISSVMTFVKDNILWLAIGGVAIWWFFFKNKTEE